MADPRRIAKTFTAGEPPAMAAGERAAGMDFVRPFSPGTPIGPYDGYERTPRSRDFVTGYNISARPRSHERIGFDTLRGLVEAYDVAQMAIWHRIDSIRSLDWSLVARKGYGGDVTDAIDVGMAALAKPDRQTPFGNWLAAWLYDILAFDAGTLYRLRNRRGDAIGLRVVDGTSIAPLLDYWGNSPEPPAEAYVQYAQGLPWNWLTRDDLVYEPFRKKPNSPYGLAPLETILLNANTDLRFQVYFLEKFTEGNLPSAFASAPEAWTPQQIEQFQEYWDSFMLGDQAAKHQVKWLPGGSKLEWSNEKDFQDHFSLFLMRKTAAAFHVVPADLGFTENVNKSSGESQADVQHRVGDLPLLRHIQGILTSFLQDDLGLPLEFAFDLGEEQADRLQQAQADKIYVELGVIGASDIRQMRYGMAEPEGQPVPRFIYTTRSGPIPLSSLYAVAGQVDPSTAAPEPGAPLPHAVFGGVEGVLPNPPIKVMSLAEQEFGEQAMPPAPPPQPVMQPDDVGLPGQVAKDGAATAGVTTATGIVGYDLDRDDDEHEPEEDRGELAKAEQVAFRRFAKARRRAGAWRDFEFRHTAPRRGRRLNQAGRLAVRKAAGEVAVAGLAVRAADTGRVLMLQRALDPDDPAGGCWEFPGGHLEDGETPLRGAWREWAEEVHVIPPPGAVTGSWVSADGVYEGVVWTVDSEDAVPLAGRDQVSNPDDPDGDCVEAVAWWDPGQLAGNPAVRPELLASLPDVLAALGVAQDGDESECPCGTPAVYDEANGWQHADGSISHDDGESVSDKMRQVAKADAGPKGDAPTTGAHWPGWDADMDAARHWAEAIAAAYATVLTVRQAQALAGAYLAQQPDPGEDPDRDALVDAAVIWLAAQGLDLAAPIAGVLPGLWADGYLVGLTSAHAVATGRRAERGGWEPGDTVTARQVIDENGAADGLTEVVDQAQVTAESIAETRRRDLARELVNGLLAGLAAAAIGRALTGVLRSTDKALTVALTEITRSSGLAALVGYRQQGVTKVRWVAEIDGRTCPACLRNAGADPVPIGTSFPSGDAHPPIHPRCFPAGVVVTGPSVVAATARKYEGDLVTIVLASGQEVPVTPNHPVLTPDGWVAAGDLNEGAELLRAVDAERVAVLLYPDDRQAVSRIEDVAASLGEALPVATARVPLAAEDFHGDGSGSDEVDVVLAAGHAEFDRVAELPHEVGEAKLFFAEGPSGLRGSEIDALLGALGTTSGSLMGRCEHGVPLFWCRPLPADGHGRGAISAVDSGLAEHSLDSIPIDPVRLAQGLHGHPIKVGADEAVRSGDAPRVGLMAATDRDATLVQVLPEGLVPDSGDLRSVGQVLTTQVGGDSRLHKSWIGDLPPRRESRSPELLPEGGRADAGDGQALSERLSEFVELDRVVELRRVHWVGHVYNLETVDGWYFANGIIAHNCRCAVVPA